ncbi:WD40/YVTN/BNR-like repeat-containing protein [Patescibacteria group bacterium]
MGKKYNKLIVIFFIVAMIALTGQSCGRSPKDAGILRSFDGGLSFEFKNWVEKEDDLAGVSFNTIIVNPLNPNEILAGSSTKGFYRSTDKGETWENVVFSSGDARVIEFDPTNEQVVFFGIDSSIYKTEDGINVREVFVDQTGYIEDIVILASDPNTVYAITSSGNYIVSADRGENWRALSFIDGFPRRVIIDPVNPLQVLVGTQGEGIYRSLDGGNTFSPSSFENFDETSKLTQTVNDMSLNPFNPSEVVAATDYGLFKSSDTGRSWSMMDTLVIPGTVPLRAVEYHPIVQNVIFFTSGNSVYISENGGSSWSVTELETTREIYDIAIHPNDKNEMYLSVKGAGQKKSPVDFLSF